MTHSASITNGYRIPAWLWGAIALAGLGWAGASKLDSVSARLTVEELRMCRVEVALHIPPAPLCYQGSQP